MISYELGLKLKKADFKQGNPVRFKDSWVEEDGNLMTDGEPVHIPDTSELIETLGTPLYLHCAVDNFWYAQDGQHTEANEGRGRSADEALAELWLAKNKK